jgi:hypothetical protein
MDMARQQCDVAAIAADLMSPGKQSRDATQLPRHTGLDDGPRL